METNKVLLVYKSKHGTSQKVASYIASRLEIDSKSIVNLKEKKQADLSGYDTIIVGGSVHAGNVHSSLKKFIEDNMVDLLQKKVGLFLCGMQNEEAGRSIENAFPGVLREHSLITIFAGGEFIMEKMNFLERAIVKKVSGNKVSQSKIDYTEIDRLVSILKQ